MLFSGIHATLAGVVLAMMIPINGLTTTSIRSFTAWSGCSRFGSLSACYRSLASPMIASRGPTSSLSPLGLGIVAGLFLGKQVGIAASVFLTASP
jgi:NhaA family Na+:H+ antiporter